jgi:hypothetical protein
VTAIAAGAQHSYALKGDGSVWAWGENSHDGAFYGALGDGTTKDSRTPVRARGLSGVVAIAAGGQHALARKADGSIWTWGWNDYGQLGREAIQGLEYAGTVTGPARGSRATYIMANAGFPLIRFDKARHKIFLHPGESSTSQWAASLGYDVPTDGQYTVSGVFQRANPSLESGHDVDVAVILDTDAARPLWEEHISSLDGREIPFHIRRPLLRGQVLRFVVFRRYPAKDETLADTSLEATIER